ncbi:MAG: MotA/TolQ/ExbB proton channel family protein [Rickettsiales bacterium]|nr:MotA/TolQ/ExbB proton channel family protein [Rickettsiales bacterium]
MSFSSLLGVLFGFGLFFTSIYMSTDNWIAFVSLSSILMVVGGTTAAAFMSFQARYVFQAFKALWWMLKAPQSTREGLNTEILRLIQWAYLVQKSGLPSLENEIKKVNTNDPVLRFALTMVSSGYKPEEVREIMETAVESEFDRHTVPVAVLKQMAAAAPAFGMIGTLVGLVVMLQGLDGDMAKLGQGLSLALLTTLYGVVLARMFFIPAALKLMQKEEIQRFRNEMMAEGLIMLSEKKNPRYMQDRLNSYLDPEIHFNLDKQLRGR